MYDQITFLIFEMLKTLLFVLTGLVLSSWSLSALVIDPPGVKLSSLPGERIEGFITLKNEKGTPIELEIVHRNSSSTAEKFPDWLTLEPEKMSLEPHEERQLHYKVSIPKEATGQFLSVIGFDEKVDGDAQMLKMRTRISIYLATTVLGTEIYAGDIKSLSFNPNRPTLLNVLLENTGNVYVKSKGVCRITDSATGDLVTVFSVNPRKAPVYARTSRNLVGKMNSPLQPGDYEIAVEFPFPDEARLIRKTVPLTISDQSTSDR